MIEPTFTLPGDLTGWTGWEGLEVYEEIHNDPINRFIHAAFLPFVIYGTMLGLPALFNIKRQHAYYGVGTITFAYILFYSTFSFLWAFAAAFMSLPFAMHAVHRLKVYDRVPNVRLAVISLVGALFIQEVIGHTLFEEVNSRMTFSYVFNAIMYSPMFYSTQTNKYLVDFFDGAQFYACLLYIIINCVVRFGLQKKKKEE